MIPECMLQNIAQPHRKPSEGEYASRRNTYTPPLSGYTEASSAQINAPASVSSPARVHTRTTPATERISPVISEGCTKIDAPMIVPTTIAVARTRPMERRRLVMITVDGYETLAAVRHPAPPRKPHPAHRGAAASLDGVRRRAAVLERERHRRRLQRAAHADRATATGSRVGTEGVPDPVLLHPLRHVHLRPRGLRVCFVRRAHAAARVRAELAGGLRRHQRAAPRVCRRRAGP